MQRNAARTTRPTRHSGPDYTAREFGMVRFEGCADAKPRHVARSDVSRGDLESRGAEVPQASPIIAPRFPG